MTRLNESRCACLLLACLLFLPLAHAQKAPEKPPDFPDYPVPEVYKGKPARPRILTPYQRAFRGRIREGMEQEVNFAGHYIVATWGCGTGCMQFAVTDAASGQVYDPPMKSVSYHFGPDPDKGPQKFPDMVNVKPDSALLVVEGCQSESEKCGRYYYRFEKGGFTLLLFDPDPPDPGNKQ